MKSLWAQWLLTSPASRLFTQPFIQAQIKENIKDPRRRLFCGELTGDRWIPRTKGLWRGRYFHLLTSSCNGKCGQGHSYSFITCLGLSEVIEHAVKIKLIYIKVWNKHSKYQTGQEHESILMIGYCYTHSGECQKSNPPYVERLNTIKQLGFDWTLTWYRN